MSDEPFTDDKPLSFKSVCFRLRMLIDVSAMQIYSVEQASALMKNINDDLRKIRASLEHLNDKVF
jgi:hypothetical protein